ncbi:MAG: O-antigen ligase family protein, partial [Chloroflexota bacterium]|nr:O-antigen ligase family protein [Chloroflexota bacterium]
MTGSRLFDPQTGVVPASAILVSGLMLVFLPPAAAWAAPALLLGALLLGWRKRPVGRGLLAAAALLTAGAVVGLAVSADRSASVEKLWAVLSGLLMLLLVSRLSRSQLRPSMWMLLSVGVALGFAADVQVDRNSWKLNAYNRAVYGLFAHVPRFSELALNQNAVAAWLIGLIPLGLALTLVSDQPRSRLTALLVTLFLFFQLSLTDSRAALLSLALGLAAGGLVPGGRYRWLGAMVVGGALVLLRMGVFGSFQLTALPTGDSSRERVAIWVSSLHMLADAPFTGIGLGLFQRVYPAYILPAYHTDHPHAHNLLLQTGADMGLLGIAGWLGFMVLAGWWIVDLARRPEPDSATR